MTDAWETFAIYDDEASADTVAGRLRLDGVPATVVRDSPVPGIDRFCVLVPSVLAHRARWVMSLAATSEAELTYLATGELPVNGGDPQ